MILKTAIQSVSSISIKKEKIGEIQAIPYHTYCKHNRPFPYYYRNQQDAPDPTTLNGENTISYISWTRNVISIMGI